MSASARILAAAAAAALALPAFGQALPRASSGEAVEIAAQQGIEWHRDGRKYVARGDVRASQGDVVVYADVLTAHYYEAEDGGTSIWRIEADRNVRIETSAQKASGDRGVYDVDGGTLVLTGDVSLDTETDRITASDSLEYRERESLAIARGNAVARRGDNQLQADVLTARIVNGDDGKAVVKEVDAIDNVVLTTPQNVVRSRRGNYDLESGIVRLTGAVRITQGRNQLNGDKAEIDLNNGISRLLSGDRQGVSGIFIPDSESLPRARRGNQGAP